MEGYIHELVRHRINPKDGIVKCTRCLREYDERKEITTICHTKDNVVTDKLCSGCSK